ncbi:predicted protein [Plenodomus lingam JN3]|uniref:Predicted protein n=1 Tax=Leptosphaeria maculans (strain JN3 / isolate v23.1.3 / race Av1-4-5-6-7-8) TaxID=985895 RepID=E4ZI38_LEPMJ|nr:predicted protein [Plenodomus lingam JN3]CBX91181.1 predicted protein [Plenodomus lingam JN3]
MNPAPAKSTKYSLKRDFLEDETGKKNDRCCAMIYAPMSIRGAF